MNKVYCVHCGIKVANRPRLLCWTCYYNDLIRELYPGAPRKDGSSSIPGGVGLTGSGLAEPTSYLPGSEEKIEEMGRRAEGGKLLWHPEDAVEDVS